MTHALHPLNTAIIRVLILVWLLPHVPTFSMAEPAPLIPLKDFFRNPEKTGFKLSPDGKTLSFLAPYESRLNIHVHAIGSDKITRLTAEKDRSISTYFWVSNDRIAFLKDEAGNENFHLYAVNTDGSDFVALTPFPDTRVSVVDDLENDPDHAIIRMNRRDRRLFDAFRINLKTGDLKLLAENPGNFAGYRTDNEGNIRIAYVDEGLDKKILYRKTVDDEWTELLTTQWQDTFSISKFTFDNEKFWAISNLGRDKTALVLYNPDTKKVEEEIFSHPQVDLIGASYSDKREIMTSVSFVAAYRTFVYFDPVMENIHRKLEEKLAPLQVRFADASKDESKLLITTFSDKDHGDYHIYDVKTEKLTHLADNSPWLNPEHMADMEPITFESRDGLFIHGYLTTPAGVEPKNLPLVVLPHGGPHARDSWGFKKTTQFLANRGYAVMQVNFRGGTGYGRKFMELGFGQ